MDIGTLARAVHLYSVMIWFGGLLITSWCGVFMTQNKSLESKADFYLLLRRALLILVNPFMVLAWITGLYVLLGNWSSVYAKMPWMHAKLLLVFILTGITGYVSASFKRAAQGKESYVTMRLTTTVISLIAAIVVALVRFRPF